MPQNMPRYVNLTFPLLSCLLDIHAGGSATGEQVPQSGAAACSLDE